jgi:MFS family permease
MAEKPAEPDVSLEHSEGNTHHTASSVFNGFGADEIETTFRSDFDACTNLLALFTCFFASTWMLAVPSGGIGLIVQAFLLDADKLIWVAAAVTILNCVLQSFLGDLSDHFGRKGFLLVGMALGITGSIIIGRAKSMEMVICGQVLSGCGLTIGYLAIPLTSELVPKDQRPKIQGIIGIFAGIANCIGVIIAGAFIKNKVGGAQDGWRGAFYLDAGFYAISFISLFSLYHPSARPNPENISIIARLQRIDWPGLTIFLVGLEYGGNPYKWSSDRSFDRWRACLVAFELWQAIGTKNGLLDHNIFKDRNFAMVLLLNFVGGMVLFGGQAFLRQELIYLLTSDAVLTGVYNLPFNIMGIVGGIVGGVVMTITKEAKPVVIASFVGMLIGNGLVAVLERHINYAAWFFPTALLGIAVGIQIALLPVVASLCTPNHLIAHALSLISSTRALGGSIGVVIFRFVTLGTHEPPLLHDIIIIQSNLFI